MAAFGHSKNRQDQCHPFVSFDFTNDEGVDFVINLLKPGSTFYVFARPPHTTTTAGASSSRFPLRSVKFPHGVPDLSHVDSLKVQTANTIYSNIAKILRRAAEIGSVITVAHPKNSFLWQLECISSLVQDLGLTPVSCQLCMFGGSAPQWLTLFSNDTEFLRLARPCDNSHVHPAQPHAEDLPVDFCNALLDILQQCATKRGIHIVGASVSHKRKLPDSSQRSAEAGKQPRGNKLPPIISEFKQVLTKLWPFSTPPDPPRMLTAAECSTLAVPV